jgi:hypothetical protein
MASKFTNHWVVGVMSYVHYCFYKSPNKNNIFRRKREILLYLANQEFPKIGF